MSDNWKTHAKNWSKIGYRVHLIDQRNHGRSFWSNDFSYKLMAKDIAEYFLSWNLLSDILSNLVSSYFFIQRRTLRVSLLLNKLLDKKGLSSIL